MANVPFPLTGENIEDMRFQTFELIRQVFEEKIGGAELGDVFSIPGDVLTLVLASPSGLTKSGNKLAIEPLSTGGMQIASTGLSIKIVSTGGLETTASGIGIKLDGASLTLSASGLKLTDPITITSITLNNNGLKIKDADASHTLQITPGSDLTGNKILTLTTGDSDRTINLIPDTGWSVTNVTLDKTYDADTAGCTELADVLGTLINTLITKGILSA